MATLVPKRGPAVEAAEAMPVPLTKEEAEMLLDDPTEDVNDGYKACFWCDEVPREGAKLNKCSLCLAVRYCSRACQKAHWKNPKGRHPQHKAVCVTAADKPSVAAALVEAIVGDPASTELYDDERLRYDPPLYRLVCDGVDGTMGGLHGHLLRVMEGTVMARPGSYAASHGATTVCGALQCLFNASRMRQRPTVSAADVGRVKRFLRFDRARCWPAWLASGAASVGSHFHGEDSIGEACRGILAMTAMTLTHANVAAFALEVWHV